MLKEIKFMLTYFGCFIGMSMLATMVADGHPTEMFGFVLWGNIAYFAAGFIPWIIINRLSLLINSSLIRYTVRFVCGLLVMYLLISIANPGSSINSVVFLGVTMIYILSFIIASIGYTANNPASPQAEELQPNQ